MGINDREYDRKQENAQKRKDKDANKAGVPFRGFVNANPSQADKENFKAWFEEEGVFTDGFTDALTRGYKFSVTYEANGGYFRATAVTWVAGDANSGTCLSLRAGDAVQALARAVWWLVWKCNYSLAAPTPASYDPEAW